MRTVTPRGSFFMPGEVGRESRYRDAGQIRVKYEMTTDQFASAVEHVQSLSVLEALSRFPEGVYYDILLYLVVTSR